jgi:hypothetical protein
MLEDVNLLPLKIGRLVRVVEGARLESVYTGNRIEGSNPSVSANTKQRPAFGGVFLFVGTVGHAVPGAVLYLASPHPGSPERSGGNPLMFLWILFSRNARSARHR